MNETLRYSFEKTFRSRAGNFRLCAAGEFELGATQGIAGSSGSGKTSFLRILAGLEEPDAGEIHFGSSCWYSSARRIFVPPWRRGAGLVFQDYGLFPSRDAWGNVRYGSRSDEDARAALRLVGMGDLARRRADELSGGQRQRIAIARSLAAKPRLLLLDEPLSALDEKLRDRLAEELAALPARAGLTLIVVSHRASDLARMGCRVTSVEEARALFDEAPPSRHPRLAIAPRAVEFQRAFVP